jgi:hypothetical protein
LLSGSLPPEATGTGQDTDIRLKDATGKKLSVQYLGCGGLYLLHHGEGIMIDPFFSNQKIGRLLTSTICNKRKVVSDTQMVNIGLNSISRQDPLYASHTRAIFVAHSHYDHLLDVPAVFQRLQEKPLVYLNECGRNICGGVLGNSNIRVLEANQTTNQCVGTPVWVDKQVRVYPILAKHNPHIMHIKFFDGSIAEPVPYFQNPYDKTRANDWLEGNTYAFLVDYFDEQGHLELRIFVQSSSCTPGDGIPPDALLKERPVDIAFLGVASYEASPAYPDVLLSKITPQKIVWVHWEDFFRRYDKKPRTVRATDVRGFFKKSVVKQYAGQSIMPWPRTVLNIEY